MKAIKFFAALFVAATVFTACEQGGQQGGGGVTPPVITPDEQPTMPEVAEVEGAYVIVAQFQEKPCNDVILVGAYKLADGSVSAWSAEPTVKFEADRKSVV